MFNWLLLFIGLIAPDYTASVAVEAALVLHAQPDAPARCCGRCQNGVITQGDGHKTPCPCPPDCKCKTRGAVLQPAAVLKCESGKCPSTK